MPREPAYADERSKDCAATAASERAKGMDARSERPAHGAWAIPTHQPGRLRPPLEDRSPLTGTKSGLCFI
ncbi:MAG: hypothetical protein RLZZ440_873 [Planctomycetota bacterium]